MAKILITGGTGFIGSNLVKRLHPKNEIVVFADIANHPFLNGLKIKIVKGDIRDYSAVLDAVKGCDYVYHLAASTLNEQKDRKKIFDINVLGTENVLKACLKARVKKVVYVSSSAALGFSKQEKLLNEDNYLDFRDNLYGQSKKIGEDKVLEYVGKGLNATIVIPSYVIGAGEIDAKRYGLFKSIARGRIKFTYPGGSSTVAVEDIVNGLILAMKNGKAGERYIISNKYIRLYDFYNLIARIMKKPKIKFRIPRIAYYPMYLLGAFLEKVMKNSPLTKESVRWHFNYKACDSSKARKELKWKPKISLDESIRRAIKYYKSIGVLIILISIFV